MLILTMYSNPTLHSILVSELFLCVRVKKHAIRPVSDSSIDIDFLLRASLSLFRFVGRINIYLDRDEPIAR